MNKIGVSLLCVVLSANVAFAEESIQEFLKGRTVEHFVGRTVKDNTHASRAGDFCYVTFNLNYTSSTMTPYAMFAFNKRDSYVNYYRKAQGNTPTVMVEPGTYDLVAEYFNNTDGTFRFVVKEQVVVDKDVTYLFNFSDANKEIDFKMLLPDGSEQTLDNLDADTQGNTAYTVVAQTITHDDCGVFFYAMGQNESICASDYTFGDKMYNFYINDVSDRWHFSQSRVAFPTTEIDDTREAYSAFWSCSGVPEGSLVNDIATYTKHPYEMHLTPTNMGQYGGEAYQMGLTVAWDSIASPTYMVLPSPYVSTTKIKHSFMSDFDTETTRILPLYNFSRIEYSDYAIGNTLYVATPEGISYPMNGYVGNPSITNWHALDDTGSSAYKTYPGHPVFSASADQIDYKLGNCAPLFVMRIAYMPWIYGKEMAVDYRIKGRLGELRETDVLDTELMLYKNGTQLTEYYDLASGWEAALKDENAKYDLTLVNNNIMVDDIEGTTTAKIHWDLWNHEYTPPMLQALQFRDARGVLTDHFKTLEGAKMYVAATDLTYRYGTPINQTFDYMVYFFEDSEPITVTAQCSAHGENKWTSLELTNLEEYDSTWGFGKTYEASLESLAGDEQWYDVKLLVTDAAGNYQEQTIAPAFLVSSSSTGISSAINTETKPIEWYTIDGRRADANSVAGIRIVKYSDGSVRKEVK